MTDEPTFLSLIDSALDSYVARAPLYLGLGAGIAAIGSAIMLGAKLDDLESQALAFVLLAPMHGIVARGIARSSDGTVPPASELARNAVAKLPELLACLVIAAYVGSCTVYALFDNSLASSLAMVPCSLAWGAASLTDVAVAIDDPVPADTLPDIIVGRVRSFGHALMQPFGYIFRLEFLSRLASLAVIQIPIYLLISLISHQLETHHIKCNQVWLAFVVACLSDGVYESIFTTVFQRFRAA